MHCDLARVFFSDQDVQYWREKLPFMAEECSMSLATCRRGSICCAYDDLPFVVVNFAVWTLA